MASPEAAKPRRRRTLWAGALLLTALLAGPAVAGIRIEVHGVDAELERNILALLSMARYTDRTRLEPDAVDRLYRRVNDEVAAALRPFGYYHPVIDATLTRQERANEWLVHIAVSTGPPMIVDSIDVAVHGAGASDPVFTALLQNMPLRKGERLLHQNYDRLKAQLAAVALNFGYLDAHWEASELRTDAAANLAAVRLHLGSGARYHFGPTTIHQDAIRADRMQRLLQYSEGEPYDDLKRLRTQFAMDDSLYFSSVTVNTGVRDGEKLIVPIDISAVPSRRSYQFAVGYGDDTGARGSISWLNPRVNSLGHRLQLRLQASLRLRTSDAAAGPQELFDARYDVPFGDLVREKMSLNFNVNDTQVSETLRTSGLKLIPSITQVRGRWQRVLSLGITRSITSEASVPRQVDDLLVPGVTFASVPEGYLGEALLSRALYAELLGSPMLLGAKAGFLRVDLQSERRLSLRPAWHLLLRGEIGALKTDDVTQVPGEYRFFAGGDRSVRGFGPNQLSPLRQLAPPPAEPERVGAKDLLVMSVELQRDLPKRLVAAAFTDIGNAVDSFSDPLAYSVGVGLRWRLPGLTLGLDIAQALHAPGFDSLPGLRLHLNISQTL
jgi:translocation and assembly module TamA